MTLLAIMWSKLFKIILNLQPRSLHGTDIGPIHICDSSVPWSSFECLNGENKCISKSSAGFWDPLPHTGLSCLLFIIQGKIFSLTATWYVIFCQYTSEACLFQNRNEGGVDESRTEGRGSGKRGGRATGVGM